jgi:Flp pilus assembly protein TadG
MGWPTVVREGPIRMWRRGDERASAVLLAPLAVVIVVFLGSISVDSTALFLTRRSLSDAAAAAANDAASAGFDADRYAETGEITIDGARAARVARASVAAHTGQLPADVTVAVHVHTVDGDPTVRVTLTATAAGVVLRRGTLVTATASAHPVVAP